MTVPPLRASRALAGVLLLAAAGHGAAADPQRGARLFATPPAAGLLACADCHGAEPQDNNFGNIWAGRNAVLLIQRAVQANTGGMGYFGAFYGAADLADIAAYLGNTPTELEFASTEVGRDSAPRSVRIATSTKIGVDALALRTEGDFVVAGSNCAGSVPRFSTCSVDLVFRPTASGQRSGSLLIDHDGTPTPVRIELSGRATARPAAVARLEPARLAFTRAGPAGVQSASVLNDSTERLTLGSIASTGPAFRLVGGSCQPGAVLLPGRRCEVALRFDAPGPGPATGSLILRHDGVGARSTLALSGQHDGSAPAWLQADVPELDFGSLPLGARRAVQTVTWRNAGAADWRWQATRVGGPGLEVLADGCRSAGPVAPGQACAVVLAFDPRRAGYVSGRLLLEGAGGAAPATLPLSAHATAGSALLAAAPAALSFSSPARQRVQRQLQLLAQGDTGVALAAITLQGDDAAQFALSPDSGCTVGALLKPATGCTLGLEFTAARTGLHRAVLRVQPAGGAAAIDVPLAAIGVDAAAAPLLHVDAAALDVGEVALGTLSPSRQRVTLFNAGTAPWQPAAITTTGADAASFVPGGSCVVGQALDAGARCTVDVAFTPSAAGLHQASLLLQGVDGDAPALVSLSGRAVASGVPRLQAGTGWLEFAPLRPGGVAARQISIVNQGSAAAAVPRWRLDGPFRLGRLGAGCLAPLAPGEACTVELLFEPTAPGVARGRLRFGGMASVTLWGEAVDAASAQLAWQAPVSTPSHGTAAVGGALLRSAFLTLVNRGDAASAPLLLALRGSHGNDFSIDAAGGCRAGRVLAPRESCSLRVAFHPSAVGLRRATLRVQAGAAFAELPLQGAGRAEARGLLQALPRAVSFEVAAGANPGAASVFWSNDGPAALAVSSLGLRGGGFRQEGGGCPAPPFILQPGQACSAEVAWGGGADARFGAELVARVDDAAAPAVPLAVVEDVALRSNVGGGGAFGAAWGLLLTLAALALRRAESRHA